jgi:hypothetical protein
VASELHLSARGVGLEAGGTGGGRRFAVCLPCSSDSHAVAEWGLSVSEERHISNDSPSVPPSDGMLR